MFGMKKVAMLTAEFLGTGVLTLVFLAVSKSNLGLPYFIALAIGLALVGLTLVLSEYSGAHFNPAITIGLWSARRVGTAPAVAYVAAQLAGGFGAYLLFTYFVGQTLTWQKTGHFDAKIMIAEAVGTFIFSLGWAAAAYKKLEGSKAATAVGITFVLGMIGTSFMSLSMLNPAFAIGVHNWVWTTTVLGPVVGAVVGFNLYGLVFAPENNVLLAAKSWVAPKAVSVSKSKSTTKSKKKK